MEIRSSSDAVADLLNNAIAALEANVDKSTVEQITIRNEAESLAVQSGMLADRRESLMVDATLRPFATLAYRIHRTITGKMAEYAQYANDRFAIRERAFLEYTETQRRLKAEEERRLREVSRIEEEERRTEEAAELERRSVTENRPDLKRRAEEIINEPIREIHVETNRKPALLKSGGGSVGLRNRFVCTVEDADALILAIGKREAYRDVIDWIRVFFKGKLAKDIVEGLRHQFDNMPQIPTNVVTPQVTKINQNANATNGKINWPGVAVEDVTKSRVRSR
jgi:hypothetical protein